MNKFEKVKKYYESGLWNIKQLKNAIAKGWISEEEFESIIEKEAISYLKETLVDYENHEDAAEAILTDFTEGAMKAYEILNK